MIRSDIIVRPYYPSLKAAFSSIVGATAGLLEPAFPYAAVCTAAVFADCLTAWSLSRRIRRKYPDRTADAGKFSSNRFGKVFSTLCRIYGAILLAHLIQITIIDGLPFNVTKFVAGAVCFWQIWSMLENESSCNDAKWAEIAQRFLVDKTSRHFDINLDELKK